MPVMELSLEYTCTTSIPVIYPQNKVDCHPQCVEFVRQFIPTLPIMRTPADLKPNSTPAKGCAVLLDYNHIGYAYFLFPGGVFVKHSNKDGKCGIGEDFYEWESPKIRGFYCP